MIVVTGASGQLGHAIVQSLVRFAGPGLVAATMRDPAKGRDLASLGVEIRQADFENMDTLGSAFAGATQVLLVSSNARATGGDTLAQHGNAIDAAKSAGVGRVLYTSQMASSDTSAFPPAHDHAATEAMLAASGLEWTALRNGFYASSGLRFIDDVFKTGQLRVPVDGKTAWTAHADLADAAAAILLGKASFDGPTPPLTASEALDFSDLARLVGEISGKPAERLVISDQQFSETLQGAGLPEGAIRLMLGYYIASRNGEFAAIDPTLEKLIGRKPASMRQVIEEALASAPVASS
jgi:uncharacterized protein YbjT (DUF2867 family)